MHWCSCLMKEIMLNSNTIRGNMIHLTGSSSAGRPVGVSVSPAFRQISEAMRQMEAFTFLIMLTWTHTWMGFLWVDCVRNQDQIRSEGFHCKPNKPNVGVWMAVYTYFIQRPPLKKTPQKNPDDMTALTWEKSKQETDLVSSVGDVIHRCM